MKKIWHDDFGERSPSFPDLGIQTWSRLMENEEWVSGSALTLENKIALLFHGRLWATVIYIYTYMVISIYPVLLPTSAILVLFCYQVTAHGEIVWKGWLIFKGHTAGAMPQWQETRCTGGDMSSWRIELESPVGSRQSAIRVASFGLLAPNNSIRHQGQSGAIMVW